MARRKKEEAKKVLISIKGLPMFSESEDDTFELLTDGEYVHNGDVSTIRYTECGFTGINGMVTTFDIERDRVILKRGDGLVGDMIFSETQKHNFLYDLPYGSMMMGIDTHSISKNMDNDGGNIEIRYDIELDSMIVSRNLFKIDVKSVAQ